ncbi:MAG: CxxxxCH/CxxCH domain-containing protein, partial [Polyangiaceae bacterium]|nr:CxxxxCH/CxxCH domain-containing protein [Polyangiaceae bacterium]
TAANRSCAGTYCHGVATPIWNQPRTPSQACGTCHGLPPPLPHPPITDCSRCHGAVIASDGSFVAPERHVDGQIDVAMDCSSCHGTSQSPAPPPDTSGNTSVSAPGVGAHQAHLGGGTSSRPVACSECHVVPATIDAPGHIDDWGRVQPDFLGPVGTMLGATPSYDPATGTCSGTYCHEPVDPTSSISPEWTSSAGPLACTSCHGLPPASPHTDDTRCFLCHSDVDATGQITDRGKHVNGEVDF